MQTHSVIRLVATDLDGTFWYADMVVPERHADAVRELAAVGVTVLAATSRRPRVARAGLGRAGLALPAVLVDGAIGILMDHGVQTMLYAEPIYGAYGLIVNPPGVSKWSGVDAYCRLAGIDPTEVLAVGDGYNDVAMLTRAAVSVAVKGGPSNVLEVADHVIGPPHEHGWASLLDLIGRL